MHAGKFIFILLARTSGDHNVLCYRLCFLALREEFFLPCVVFGPWHPLEFLR